MAFKKRYNGGRHIEVQGNPDTAMKKMQRWLKEDNFFMEIREREQFTTKSEEKRKSKHRAKKRQEKTWVELEKGGPCRYKRERNKANRGMKTTRTQVKKPI